MLSIKDTELYRHLLGIVPPWTVERVDLDAKAQRIDVPLEHREGAAVRRCGWTDVSHVTQCDAGEAISRCPPVFAGPSLTAARTLWTAVMRSGVGVGAAGSAPRRPPR